MTIEFVPPALKYIVSDPIAERRFKNRWGNIEVTDGNGIIPDLCQEGRILDLTKSAQQLDMKHPELKIIIIEESRCLLG